MAAEARRCMQRRMAAVNPIVRASLLHSLHASHTPVGVTLSSTVKSTLSPPMCRHHPPMPRPLQQLQHRHARFFSMPPLASDAAPKPPTAADLDLAAPILAAQERVSTWPEAPEALHLLTSSDAKGVNCVWAYGQLLLARLQTSDAPTGASSSGTAVQVR